MASSNNLKAFLILLTSLAISSAGMAAYESASRVCVGKGWILSVFGPIPLYRDLKLTLIEPQHQVTIDIGGSPLAYQGPIDLSGRSEQVMINEHSGDRVLFKLTELNSTYLRFELTFKSAENQWQGRIFPTTLTCTYDGINLN